jgi:hypothetical protein
VGAAEGVVDVDVAERGELGGEGGVVGLLFGVEAEVFEQQGLAGFELAGHLGGDLADAVGGEGDVLVSLRTWSSSSRRRSTSGRRLMDSTGLPLGRPRCEQRMTLALWRSAYSMVGRVSRMRVSSVMMPSLRGTLKSTRMSTRLWARSRSRMESLDTVVPQLVNAVLSRHNFILLGLRGQAKSRILRALTTLLDPHLPVCGGLGAARQSVRADLEVLRDLIAKMGDDTPIAWLTPTTATWRSWPRRTSPWPIWWATSTPSRPRARTRTSAPS